MLLLALHYHQTHLTRGLSGIAGVGVIIGLLMMAASGKKPGKK